MGDGDDVNAGVSLVMPIDDIVWEALNTHLAGISAKFPMTNRISTRASDGDFDLAEKALAKFTATAFGKIECGAVQLALCFVVPSYRRHVRTAA